MSDNKYYVIPYEEYEVQFKPYLETLSELMVSEEMLVDDSMKLWLSNGPRSYSPLMEYACEALSMIHDEDIDGIDDGSIQQKLDRYISTIQEAVTDLSEKLNPFFEIISHEHPVREDWYVFRLGKTQICIGVGIDAVDSSNLYRPYRDRVAERAWIV
jgi:hypothetical protein